MKSFLCLSFVSFLLGTQAFAQADLKVGCTDVDAIVAKCAEYDAETKACDDAVAAESKVRIDAAKKELDTCKSKHPMNHLLKCKDQHKKSVTMINTPKQASGPKIQKELLANKDGPCAKAEAIGNDKKVCKGPKKVLETMKANCIKG